MKMRRVFINIKTIGDIVRSDNHSRTNPTAIKILDFSELLNIRL